MCPALHRWDTPTMLTAQEMGRTQRSRGHLHILLLAGEDINVPTADSMSLGWCRDVNTPLTQA